MTPLDMQIEAVTAMIRAAGGVVTIDPNAPDYVKQAWIEAILSCPDCWEEIHKRKGAPSAHWLEKRSLEIVGRSQRR